jgi:hypothetical protein
LDLFITRITTDLTVWPGLKYVGCENPIKMKADRLTPDKFKPADLASKKFCWHRNGTRYDYYFSVRDIASDGTFILFARTTGIPSFPAAGKEGRIATSEEPMDRETFGRIEIASPRMQNSGYAFEIREIRPSATSHPGHPI